MENIDNIEMLLIEMINECNRLWPNENKNLMNISNKYKIDSRKVSSKHGILYELENILKEKFMEKGVGPNTFILRNLKSHLLLKQLGLGDENNNCIEILDFLISLLGNTVYLPKFERKQEWIEIIELIQDIKYIEPNKYKIEIPNSNVKERNEAEAIKYWKEKGYNISVSNGKIKVSSSDYKCIAKSINRAVSKIGGEVILKELFENKIKFDQKNLRYYLVREKSTLGNDIPSSLPFGYLFNISVKHISLSSRRKEIDRTFLDEIFEMSRHFAALHQLQTYNAMDDMLVPKANIIEYVHKNVLFDTMYIYKQYNPRYMIRVIRGLFYKYYTEECSDKYFEKLSFDEICSLINFSLNNNVKSQNFRIFTYRDFEVAFPNMNGCKIRKFLDIFSHENKPNYNYLLPYNSWDYDMKPFIKMDNQYVLLDRTFNSLHFFECFSSILRLSYGKRFDNELGYSFEDFIKNELKKRNIEYASGYYKMNEECDLIIETSKYIFFMEIKKKSLTKKALNGDGIEMFKDISKSIFDSQIQLGKHQLNMVKDGKIELYDKKGKITRNHKLIKTINLNGRIIERISVNLNDYGILSDKIMMQNILKHLTGTEIKSEERDDELNEVREKLMKLQQQYEEYGNLSNQIDYRKMYFNTAFMSLQLLMTKLENINGNSSFENDYINSKFVTTSSGDPYLEYFTFNR